jgi:hypothetical protein
MSNRKPYDEMKLAAMENQGAYHVEGKRSPTDFLTVV